MGKSPAFRFYPSDFMGSPDVQSMELAEVGAYTFLLCVAWQQDRHGTLPDDDSRLRRWARMNVDQWRESRELILSKFPIIEDGLRGNKRMMDESEKQQRFSESQKKKVENRWKNRGNTETIPGYEVEDTRALPSVSASVSKKTIYTPSASDIDSIYKAYPRRDGPASAKKAIAKSLKLIQARGQENPEAFLLGKVVSYSQKIMREGTERNFIKMPQGWFNDARYDSEDIQPIPAIANGKPSDFDEFTRKRKEALEQVERERDAIN